MLRARWPVVAIATVCSLIGGAYIATTAPPRYEAIARVEMQYVKAGKGDELMNRKAAKAYVTSQVNMIQDYQVAVPAAEALGLLDNPDVQASYAAIPGADPDDFAKWVARRVMASAFARPFEDSNMLEIGYVASTPQAAMQSVEAVRSAYIQATIDAQRFGAMDTAKNLQFRVEHSAKELAKIEAEKRDLETQSGAMPEVEAQRLIDMVNKKAPRPHIIMPGHNRLTVRLAEAEAELAQAANVLGPNNPSLAALKAARDARKAQVQLESDANAAVASTDNILERAHQASIDTQETKVLSLRQVQLEMRMLDDEIAGRTLVIQGMNEKIAQLRQQATYRDVGLVPVGEAEAKAKPVFPQPGLILGGTTFLGLMLGSALAIFLELTHRRARSAREFEISAGARLLGVMPKAAQAPAVRTPKVKKQDRPRESRSKARVAA